jgi:hypothetical protein
VDQDCHRVALGTTEADGVHYLWWLAARRHFFTVEDGKRTPHSESPSLEVRPGTVSVPLQAFYRGRQQSDLVNVSVEVPLPADRQARPLAALAARARGDLLLVGQAPGAGAWLYAWVKDNEMRPVPPDQITEADFARGVSRQLEWSRSFDEIRLHPEGMPGAPDRR